MSSAEDNSTTTNSESLVQMNPYSSLVSSERVQQNPSYNLAPETAQRNPSYSIVATAYSTAVRDYDYPNIDTMITGSHVRLGVPPPIPTPRAPYHSTSPSPPRGRLESKAGRMGALKKCVVVLVALVGMVLSATSLVLHFVMTASSDSVSSCTCT